jgi:hypothetical protein
LNTAEPPTVRVIGPTPKPDILVPVPLIIEKLPVVVMERVLKSSMPFVCENETHLRSEVVRACYEISVAT